MNNQSLVKINLEFAIIVSITLFVLGASFLEKYLDKIDFVVGKITSLWKFGAIILFLSLVVVYTSWTILRGFLMIKKLKGGTKKKCLKEKRIFAKH